MVGAAEYCAGLAVRFVLATARGAKAVKAGLKPLLGLALAEIEEGGGFGGNVCPRAPGYAMMNVCSVSYMW